MLSFRKIDDKSIPAGYIEGGEFDQSVIWITPKNLDKTPKERAEDAKKAGTFDRMTKPAESAKHITSQTILKAQGNIITDKEIFLYDGTFKQIPKIRPRDKKLSKSADKLAGKMIFRHYLAGPSESGKSFYVSSLIDEYIDYMKKPQIYLFSKTSEDSHLDKYKEITRVELNDELIENPIELKELANSLVLFDDVDAIPDKKLKKAILNLRDEILTAGRHLCISCICTNHIIADGHDTKTMLRESQFITVFPNSTAKSKIQRVFKTYFNVEDGETTDIFNKVGTRFITIHKDAPRYVIHRDGVYFL